MSSFNLARFIGIDWDRPIYVVDWKTSTITSILTAEEGLKLMASSSRFDPDHATSNVRTLPDSDVPVIFCQECLQVTHKSYSGKVCPKELP